MKTNVAYITFNSQEILMESFGMEICTIDKTTQFSEIVTLCRKNHYELIFVSPSVYRFYEEAFGSNDVIRVVVLDNTETPSHLGQKRMKELMEKSIGIQIS